MSRPRRRAAAPPGATALLLLGLVASWGAPAAQETAPGPPPGVPMPLMPLSEIHAGMIGTARTVFEGSSLEDFKVEILGVLKNAIGPQQDLIVGRLRGEKVEYTGVVSGMSGSPVYIDGRLIGAVSYRLGPFAKEAVAGITPIADMIKLAGVADRMPADRKRAAAQAPDLLGRFLASKIERDAPIDDMAAGAFVAERPSTAAAGSPYGGLTPIGVPLVCSGCDAGVLRYYAPIFESFGLEPTSGGGSTAASAPGPLLPGSPIGAALVTGDMSLVGIGTTTHVDGKRVFAFGHPMLGSGGMELPMTQAQVILTFASSAASFKIANATPPVGAIYQDGLTAIVGEVGRRAPTIPVSVRVRSGDARREFHYDIVRNRAWSAVLMSVVAANSLVRTTDYDAAATLSLHCRIAIDGYPTVIYDDLYSTTNPGQPVHLALANDASSLFNLLYNNRFEEARITSADLSVEALQGGQVATMESLRASRTEVRPGERLTVTASIEQYRGRAWEESWDIVIPEDAAPGDAEVVVGSGPALDSLERRILERQVTQAGSLGDLVKLAQRQRRSRTLYLRLMRRAPAAIVRTEVLPDLPLSIFSVFNNPRLSADTTLMADAPILEVPKDLDVTVLGGRRISIRIK